MVCENSHWIPNCSSTEYAHLGPLFQHSGGSDLEVGFSVSSIN